MGLCLFIYVLILRLLDLDTVAWVALSSNNAIWVHFTATVSNFMEIF